MLINDKIWMAGAASEKGYLCDCIMCITHQYNFILELELSLASSWTQHNSRLGVIWFVLTSGVYQKSKKVMDLHLPFFSSTISLLQFFHISNQPEDMLCPNMNSNVMFLTNIEGKTDF